MDKGILRHLGLSDNEIDIYIALIKAGPSPVSVIAEKTGMYRPYVYDTLDRLLEKGLASFVIQDKKKFYSATRPEKLLDYLNEKKKEVESIMPDLISFADQHKEEPSVSLIKGNEVVTTVLKTVYSELKKHGGENLLMGADDSLYLEHSPVYMKKFISLLEKSKFHERIISGDETTVFVGSKISKYRFLSKEFFNPTATHIAGNTVCIIVWSSPLIGILIESRDVADAYRKYFNLLWKIAKKKKWKKTD